MSSLSSWLAAAEPPDGDFADLEPVHPHAWVFPQNELDPEPYCALCDDLDSDECPVATWLATIPQDSLAAILNDRLAARGVPVVSVPADPDGEVEPWHVSQGSQYPHHLVLPEDNPHHVLTGDDLPGCRLCSWEIGPDQPDCEVMERVVNIPEVFLTSALLERVTAAQSNVGHG